MVVPVSVGVAEALCVVVRVLEGLVVGDWVQRANGNPWPMLVPQMQMGTGRKVGARNPGGGGA